MPTDARLQDAGRLPQGRWPSHPGRLRAVRGAVTPAEPVQQGRRRDRRLEVRGGEQPRQELYSRSARSPADSGRGRHRPLPRGADRADRDPSNIAEARTERLRVAITGLREQMQVLQATSRRVEAAPDSQVSLRDPDARSMATGGKGASMVRPGGGGCRASPPRSACRDHPRQRPCAGRGDGTPGTKGDGIRHAHGAGPPGLPQCGTGLAFEGTRSVSIGCRTR